MGLYTGSSLTSLQQVNCSNNNRLANYTDTMTTKLQVGKTYYLQVSGTGGKRSGVLKLSTSVGCQYNSTGDNVVCPA
jgi:hypothetical protein